MLTMSDQGLAIAVTVIFAIGSSTLGTIGTCGEYLCKKIDEKNHPKFREIALLYTQNLQSATAGFTLLLIGSLFINPIGSAIAFLSFGIILTPLVNHAVQKFVKNDDCKKAFKTCNQVVNIVSKLINIAAVTTGIGLSLGIPAAIIGGAGLSALSYLAYRDPQN